CQHATDGLAANISGYLAQRQQEFSAQVESIVDGQEPAGIASRFDEELRRRWDLAEVGFCVTLSGKILSPSPDGRSEARMFYYDNSGFLGNREAVEVYPNALNAAANMPMAAAVRRTRTVSNRNLKKKRRTPRHRHRPPR